MCFLKNKPVTSIAQQDSKLARPWFEESRRVDLRDDGAPTRRKETPYGRKSVVINICDVRNSTWQYLFAPRPASEPRPESRPFFPASTSQAPHRRKAAQGEKVPARNGPANVTPDPPGVRPVARQMPSASDPLSGGEWIRAPILAMSGNKTGGGAAPRPSDPAAPSPAETVFRGYGGFSSSPVSPRYGGWWAVLSRVVVLKFTPRRPGAHAACLSVLYLAMRSHKPRRQIPRRTKPAVGCIISSECLFHPVPALARASSPIVVPSSLPHTPRDPPRMHPRWNSDRRHRSLFEIYSGIAPVWGGGGSRGWRRGEIGPALRAPGIESLLLFDEVGRSGVSLPACLSVYGLFMGCSCEGSRINANVHPAHPSSYPVFI